MLNDERMTKSAAEIRHRFGFCHLKWESRLWTT